MGETKTEGILLRQIELSGDDVLCEFFTLDRGKIPVMARKLVKSQKRKAELDFFRLLELELFQGRNNTSLKTVKTIELFPITKSYSAMEKGFFWLERLHRVLPEEKPFSELFSFCVELWKSFDAKHTELFDIYFRIKLLDYSGLMTRFDAVRGNIWFDPGSFEFSSQERKGMRFLPNEMRQMMEFLRREDIPTFQEKKGELPRKYIEDIQLLLEQIEQYHT